MSPFLYVCCMILTCFALSPQEEPRVAVVYDFDDTLFATTVLDKKYPPGINRSSQSICGENDGKLKILDKAVSDSIRTADTIANQVFIISNGADKWLKSVIDNCLEQTRKAVHQTKVIIYSRDGTSKVGRFTRVYEDYNINVIVGIVDQIEDGSNLESGT